MSTIRPNFNNFQAKADAAAFKDASTVGAKKMNTMVTTTQTGATKQNEKNRGVKQPGEQVSPELAKLLEANEAEANKDAQSQNEASSVDESAQQNLKKKDIGRKDEDDTIGVGKRGKAEKLKPGYVMVEGTDEDDSYAIKETDKNKLERMEGKSHYEQKILGDMPEHVREASNKMVVESIKEKGAEKVSQMKEGKPEFNEAIEGMDLNPAEDAKEAGSRPAPIKSPQSKDFKPMMLEDPFAEETMNRAAKEQAKNGGGQEAMIAS